MDWYAISIRQLASRLLVAPSTTFDAVTWAESKGLLVAERLAEGSFLIRPDATGLAQAFFRVTKNAMAHREYVEMSNPHIEWTNSYTRVEAFERSPGTTVHDVFVAICGRNHFAARLLSQLVWRFADSAGRCQAATRISGNLWWGTTYERLAAELAVSPRQASRGIEALLQESLLLKIIRPWRGSIHSQSRPMLHLRPNVPVLEKAVQRLANHTLVPKENNHEEDRT